MEKRKHDEYLKPDSLHFDGVTDEDGKLTVNFQYKACHFSTDYEVARDSLCLDAATFLNVLKSDRSSQETAFVFIKKIPRIKIFISFTRI